MCGIAGFVGSGHSAQLKDMCGTLVHRGPDDEGFFHQPGIGLSMRRLSVIDLLTGRQPISNETRDVWVVFNGEIYNYEDLRDQLVRKGHVFATASDTETIVHLYEEYGDDCVQHLRGMFAIAVWDVTRQRLLIARDRIGEKPLYYAQTADGLLFGSEIKAILRAGVPRVVNPQAVCDFLAAGYVGGAGTFYQGIFKLPPAHLLVFEAGRLTVRRYWTTAPRPADPPPFREAAESLAAQLEEVVRLCLKSDVEVGAFLSGGIDSSVLVALMRRQAAHVKTFSVGYRGAAAGFNELSYAKRVADLVGSEHQELVLEARSTMDLFPKILWHYDEPHGEPTSVLIYLLSEFTQRSVKVAVGGTGADEIFYGYPRHRGVRMLEYYRRMPRLLRSAVVERVVSRWPESTNGSRFAKRARRFIVGSDSPPAEAYLSWVSLLHADVRDALLSDEIKSGATDPSGEWFLRQHLMGADTTGVLDGAAALDIEGYLPEYQLAYVDRMSMAHGLEVRSPFCDYQLVESVRSLPVDYRLRRNTSKYIFKEVARRWLPADIVNRKKVGFDSPIGQWFKEDLQSFIRAFLSPDQLRQSKLLNADAVQRHISDHLSGTRDYSLQLWSVMALEGWYRMYIEDDVSNGADYDVSDFRGVDASMAASLRA
jgi:asparagine synthase (glutamine-hydrolysing)